MKKKFYFLSVVSFLRVLVCYGQFDPSQFLFDNIDIGNSDIPSMVGQYGNWGSTHGSPSYTPTNIYMWYNKNLGIGEGIFRKFNFRPNTDYYITVGIIRASSTYEDGKDGFKILLANNVIAAGVPDYGSAIPSFTNSRVLYSYVGDNFVFHTLHLKFSTGSNESYNDIVLYPQTTTGGAECYLVIDCITIMSCPKGDVYYYNASLPDGITNSNNIFIGSSYGSTSSFTNSNPNSATDMIAIERIDLESNTNLSVNSNNVITLDVIGGCYPVFPLNIDSDEVESEFIDNGFSSSCGINKPASTLTNDNRDLIIMGHNLLDRNDNKRDVSLYPNPTKDFCTISFNHSPGQYIIEVLSPNGEVVMKLKGIKPKMDIDMSQLSSGLYFVRVNYEDNFIIEKIVKI